MASPVATGKSLEAEAAALVAMNPESAIDLWKKAATLYKMQDAYDAAAKCHVQAAQAALDADLPLDAAFQWEKAGDTMKEGKGGDAPGYWLKAAQIHEKANRLGFVARLHNKIADWYRDASDFKQALVSYDRANKMFLMEERKTEGYICLREISMIHAQLGGYDQALVTINKSIAYGSKIRLLLYGVTFDAFYALLCQWASLVCPGKLASLVSSGSTFSAASVASTIKQSLLNYQKQVSTFEQSQQSRFIVQLCAAYEKQDTKACDALIEKWNTIHFHSSSMGKVQMTLLAIIQKSLGQVSAPTAASPSSSSTTNTGTAAASATVAVANAAASVLNEIIAK